MGGERDFTRSVSTSEIYGVFKTEDDQARFLLVAGVKPYVRSRVRWNAWLGVGWNQLAVGVSGYSCCTSNDNPDVMGTALFDAAELPMTPWPFTDSIEYVIVNAVGGLYC